MKICLNELFLKFFNCFEDKKPVINEFEKKLNDLKNEYDSETKTLYKYHKKTGNFNEDWKNSPMIIENPDWNIILDDLSKYIEFKIFNKPTTILIEDVNVYTDEDRPKCPKCGAISNLRDTWHGVGSGGCEAQVTVCEGINGCGLKFDRVERKRKEVSIKDREYYVKKDCEYKLMCEKHDENLSNSKEV